MAMFLNVKDFSKYMECSVSAVYKALRTNRIQRRADGLIDAEAGEKAWHANTNWLMQRKRERPATREAEWIFDPATSTFSPATGNELETDWDSIQLSFEQWDSLMRHTFPSIRFE